MRALTSKMLVAFLALCAATAFTNQPQTPPRAQQGTPPSPQAVTHPRAQQPRPTAPPSQQPPPNEPSTYSADALYNLANSYARAGKPGLAVLNYERAALLAPSDPDIRANLDYVRATAQVPTDPPTRFARFAQAENPNAAAWLGVIGLALLGTSLLASKATQRFRGLWATTALLGAFQIALAISNAMLIKPRMREAVVLINQTPARVSPVLMGDTAFVLREAETVTMTAQHEDFVLIRTRAGRTGWVARANVGAVIP
jgi:tetratricopeptide (TPR) repeat protein